MDNKRREIQQKVQLNFKAVNKDRTGESDPELVRAKEEYKEIWERDGERIIKAMEEVAGLKFRETEIEVRVWGQWGHSGEPFLSPMMLGIRLTGDKRAILVHELLHRLHHDYKLERVGEDKKEVSEENHRILDLTLRDIWEKVYGEEFARQAVDEERKIRFHIDYGQIWDKVLERYPTVEERQKEFEKIKNQAV